MARSLRTCLMICLYLVSFTSIGIVFVFISTSYGTTTRELIRLRQLQNVRMFYNLSSVGKYDYEQWKNWENDIYLNDHLFLEAFGKPHSILSPKPHKEKSSKLALCVLSAPTNFAMRNGARKTWANSSIVPMQNTTLLFILGRSNSSEENRQVLKEKEEFGDVIIGNFTDSRGNETLKLLFSLYYVTTYFPSVEDIYIGFDSTYVHIQHLVKKCMFRKKRGVGQWRGYVVQGMEPQREKENPFYVSYDVFNESVYPTYCTLHNGFTLSSTLGKKVLLMARNETLFVFPDVFIGILAKKSGIEIKNDVSYGSQVHQPNLQLCEVRSSMTTYTFLGDPVKSWKTLTNSSEMGQCFLPDVDVVLPQMTDNIPYFNKVLKYLNNNKTICSSLNGKLQGEPIFVVALISSFVGNFEQRLAIRDTWGKRNLFYGRIVRHVFVLGKPSTNQDETQAKVDEESRKYGDIIQGNFDESFRNLTLKVVLGLKWITEFCPNAVYLYKGDEDMFVIWSRLMTFLLEMSDRKGSPVMKKLFLGSTMAGSIRIDHPKSRYYVNESMYHGKFYPRYCSGGSYILSIDMIPELYNRSLITPLIPIDDAYQGILAEQMGVHPINHHGFQVFYNMEACVLQENNLFTLHGFKTSESLRGVWGRYLQGKKCLKDPLK